MLFNDKARIYSKCAYPSAKFNDQMELKANCVEAQLLKYMKPNKQQESPLMDLLNNMDIFQKMGI